MPNPTHPTNSAELLSVSQLNRLAKQLLEDCFPRVRVLGEISNLARPSSGHWYFTLKDKNAQIRCAMFRSRNMAVRFAPAPGQQVEVTGRVSLYEGRGDYQLIVDTLQQAGAGALALAFEQLKQELMAAGWFDSARKRPLPGRIEHIAVVTSATGAAIRDILTVLRRRWPAMRISILPVMVQGEAAAGQIAAAIACANRLVQRGQADFDVILTSRGGGSLEDLWPFNERIVAQAIYDSALPVVSAVGHEVDFTIADFVADLRAPTPSAAAEILSPDRAAIAADIEALDAELLRRLLRRLQQHQQQLRALSARLRHPGQRLREQAQRLDERELRLQRATRARLASLQQRLNAARRHLEAMSPQRQLRQQRLQLQQAEHRLQQAWQHGLREQRLRLQRSTQLLRSLSPESTLQRGYAIVTDSTGKLLTDAGALTAGNRVHTRLKRGRFEAEVTTVETEESV